MKLFSKKQLLLSGAPLLSLLISFSASAETVSGKLVGYHCANEGDICPIDKHDPGLLLEPDFVLLTSDNSYYFLPNISRDTKVRHVLKDIQVKGKKHSEYNLIDVEDFKVRKSGGYKTIFAPRIIEDARF